MVKKKIKQEIPYSLEDWLKIHYPDIINEYENLMELL